MLHPVQKVWPLFRVISMDNRLEALTQLYPVQQVLEMKMAYTNNQDHYIVNSMYYKQHHQKKKKKKKTKK